MVPIARRLGKHSRFCGPQGTRSANNSIQIPIARRAMEDPTEQPKCVFKGWQDVRTVFRSISEIGFKETFKTAKKAALLRWEFWSGHRFDRKFNVDTTRLAFPQDLTLKGGSADFSRFYMATSIRVLRSAFSILPRISANLFSWIWVPARGGLYSSPLNIILRKSSAWNTRKNSTK